MTRRIATRDLKFGMIPEFTGRLPVITNLNELDNVKLTFEDDALHAVAQKAMTKSTGARGLRTIVEGCLLEIM